MVSAVEGPRYGVVAIALLSCGPPLTPPDAPPDASGILGRCAPGLFDPARYVAIDRMLTWTEAQMACYGVGGLDLAVFDVGDDAELANEASGAATPFWLGIYFDGYRWQSTDGCEPTLAWAPGEPASQMHGDIVAMGPNGMVSLAGALPLAYALCETLRPSEDCLNYETYSLHTLAQTTPTSQAGAVAACDAGGQSLVTIDSSAELAAILQGPAAGLTSFWVGADDNMGWSFSGPCSGVFTWKPNEPMHSNGHCVVYQDGMYMQPCDGTGGATASVVCESP
jgi:hypothetical protein